GDTIIKKARTFAPTAHSVDVLGAADLWDQRAAKQSLKIERQVRLDGPGFLHPWQQTLWRAQATKFAARKEVDVIYIRISAEQRCKFGINYPRNLGARIRFAKHGDRWKSVDDISERTRFNNQDRFRVQRSQAGCKIVNSFSSPHCKPFGKRSRQTGFDNLFLRGRHIVFYAHLLD